MTFPYIYKKKKLPNIVTWADGTIDEIKAMFAAHDAGAMNVYDYWSIGDKRTVRVNAMAADNYAFTSNVSAQDVVMVLLNEGYPSPDVQHDNSHVHYAIGQKDCLSVKGRMNDINTNAGSYFKSKMYHSITVTYVESLPADFQKLLKHTQIATAEAYNASTLQISGYYASLAAEKEVFGTRTYSNATEAAALSQFDYYKTKANRIKNVNGSEAIWWERSPRSDNSNSFCGVDSYGAATNPSFGSSAFGVSPIMFI